MMQESAPPSNKVVALTPESQPQIEAILLEAFARYPAMEFMFGRSGKSMQRSLAALVHFYVTTQFKRDWGIQGLFANNILASTMLMTPPPKRRGTDVNLEREIDQLIQAIGDDAFLRLRHFQMESHKKIPAYPHYFIELIGTLNAHSGKGYAGQLIATAFQISKFDIHSEGVCLSTEDPRNIPYYERFGFTTTAETKLETFSTWLMEAPDFKLSGGNGPE